MNPHEAGVLLRYDIGNIGRVAFLREVLHETPEKFSMPPGCIVYSGTDFLAVELVQRLRPKLHQLTLIHSTNSDDEQILRSFEQQMRRLVECSIQLGKPVVF